MTGSAGAIAGISQNRIFAPGLYKSLYTGYAGTDTTYFDSRTPYTSLVDGTPANQNWTNGNYTGLWLGYYRPNNAGTATFTLQISGSNFSTYNYLWLGPTAKSGYNSENALIAGGAGSTGSTSVNAGVFIPIRMQIGYLDTSGFFASSNFVFTLLIDGSIAYPIYYNSLTSGL